MDEYNGEAAMVEQMFYTRELTAEDVQKMRLQHLEWFPIKYPDVFYDSLIHNEDYIQIGCFVQVPMPVDDDEESAAAGGGEVAVEAPVAEVSAQPLSPKSYFSRKFFPTRNTP